MADPDLSEHTNHVMTDDLRVAVGADSVSVPADRHHVERAAQSFRGGPVLGLTDRRLLILIVTSMLLSIGAVLALTSGEWWIVPLALVLISGLGLIIVTTVLRMTGIREHPSATTAAALEADGVRKPDEFFSDAVTEFTATPRVEPPSTPPTGPAASEPR